MNGRRILVVDDERIVAEDISECLLNMNCEVVATAVSGPQAIERAREHRPDLIMMDITLQGEMDGIEAATHIRSELGTSCVFLTAYSDSVFLERAKLVHPAGYIVKPFDESGLRAAVEIGLFQVATERALSESQGEFQTTLMSIADGVITTDVEGNIKFVNAAAERITGLSNEQMAGHPASAVFTLFDEETGQDVENPVYAALRNERPVVSDRQLMLRCHDGNTLPVDDSAAPILDRAANKLGAVLVLRDTAERRSAERELVAYQHRLEELVNQRTEKIRQTNAQLQAEVEERRKAEESLQRRVEIEMLHASVSSTFLELKQTQFDGGICSAATVWKTCLRKPHSGVWW
jgi:two-component system cell cycle sensor histidine kinase/response regulator CckA